MSELYEHFAQGMGELDFSDDALLSLYNHESYGTGLSPRNGFAVGKQYLNVHVTMYKEDISKGTLRKFELYEWFPDWHWWLDGWLKNIVVESSWYR